MTPGIQQAFHQAIQNNDFDTVRRMIAAGEDENWNKMLDAAYCALMMKRPKLTLKLHLS